MGDSSPWGSELMATAKKISLWGIGSLVLMLGGIGFGEYNLDLYDRTGRPWIWFTEYYQICVVVQLVAVACGIVAMRGSKWWALTVAPATAVSRHVLLR
jgi:hypothetical protein